jgi:hypothetical protein
MNLKTGPLLGEGDDNNTKSSFFLNLMIKN